MKDTDKESLPPPLVVPDKKEGEVPRGKEDGSMVPIVEGIQPISGKLVQKIDAGEFIDFADLRQDQLPQEDLNLPPNHAGVVLVQSIESLRKKKRIVDFQSWAEAFMVFVAVRYREACPEVANLMAYGVILNQSAREHSIDRWLLYDRRFRELAGAKKTVKWNEMNFGLWNRYFTGQAKAKSCSRCLAPGHSSWECTEVAPKKSIPVQRKRPLMGAPRQGDKHQLCYPCIQ